MGELLFKLMMQKAVINTKAAAIYPRDSLTNIYTYISTVNLSIKNFNQYVKVNLYWLKASSERKDDIIINLLKAHHFASDKEFLRY